MVESRSQAVEAAPQPPVPAPEHPVPDGARREVERSSWRSGASAGRRRHWLTGRRALNGLLVVLIVASGVTAYLVTNSSSAPSSAAPTTGTVSRGTVQALQSASGNVAAAGTYGLHLPTAR